MATVREILAEMSDEARDKLPKKDFVFPEKKRWPFKPKKYAIYSIQYMIMGRGRREDYPAVKKAIKAAYSDDAEIQERLKKV